MRIGIGVVTIITGLFVSCGDQSKDGSWTVTVSGKVGYPQRGQIVIQEVKEGGNNWMDTIRLSGNYTFEKEVQLNEPGYYRINFYNRQTVDLILYKNDVEVSVDGNSAGGFSQVTGSPEMDLIQKVQEMAARMKVGPELERLNTAFFEAKQANDEERAQEIQETYSRLVAVQKDSMATLLQESPPSLAVINILQGGNILDSDQYFHVYEAVAEKLKKEWPDYTHAKDFIERVARLRATAIGQPAPDIALPNPRGEVVSLSSLRGKYVLVDFWAKWCGPCRHENPNLVRAYQEYNDDGFEIFGVSLDRSREDWLQAINEDGLVWTQVSDLKFWQSEAAVDYNISAIPFSVLVDPNGVIIDKNLRGRELHERLKEIFGS